MISVVVVNWNSYDWLDLLLESLHLFSSQRHEIIVIDNSVEQQRIDDVFQVRMLTNVGHGAGLNCGVQLATQDYVLVVDADCHLLRHGWEDLLLSEIQGHDIVAGKGPPSKPIRAACMFMRREIAQTYDWRDTPDYKGNRVTPEGYDVAIKAYHDMVNNGVNLKFLESQENRYGTLNGEEWCACGQPFLYHHWHGTSLHLPCRQKDFPNSNLLEDKRRLFAKIPWRNP